MEIDFEKFLEGNVTEEDSTKSLLDSIDDGEDEDEYETIEPILVTPIIEQIQSLHSKAFTSPQSFKDAYEKLEEFEKNFPQYIIDVQSTFNDAQAQLKSTYLKQIKDSQSQKITKLKEFFHSQYNQISQFIENQEYEKAHIYFQNVANELSKIPPSYFSIKSELRVEYLKQLESYYSSLNQHEDEIASRTSQMISKVLAQKRLLTIQDRYEIDLALDEIQMIFSSKRIELDTKLSNQLSALKIFNKELIAHRNAIEESFEKDFTNLFSQFISRFNTQLKQQNLSKSLLILEMAHIYLKRETKYNQDLKLDSFLKILECKKMLNQLSVSLKKALTQDELMYTFFYAKVELVKVLSQRISRFSIREIEKIKKDITNSQLLKDSYKEKLLPKLMPLLNQSHSESSLLKDSQSFEASTAKKRLIQQNISNLYIDYLHENDGSQKLKKKNILLAYIRKYIKHDLQEEIISKVENSTLHLSKHHSPSPQNNVNGGV